MALRSHGFSMAYVQEIVINALLACAHESTVPDDHAIRRSFETLRKQLSSATKPGESIGARERLGFSQGEDGEL